ncbi:hypothetical protein CRG98_036241 [Punica granatum]|uniref:Uncharacterized protein n=1 Tax=Punica granatum TaxID=22663 RepID=A0A2I0IH68_PUNGR|nr:hypothetical protein CRG98_036241 [Punica granatum]
MADLIHKVLNLVIPPPSIATLLFLLPPYLFFKSLLALINSLFSENVAGQVVLITGAPLASGRCNDRSMTNSFITKHLAYVYASSGACLALVARKESQLVEVANSVYQLGSPDVIIIRADVSKVDDCQRFVDETVEVSLLPIRSVKVVAEKIVNGACRGHGYLSEPGWIKASMYWKVFCPEILE